MLSKITTVFPEGVFLTLIQTGAGTLSARAYDDVIFIYFFMCKIKPPDMVTFSEIYLETYRADLLSGLQV